MIFRCLVPQKGAMWQHLTAFRLSAPVAHTPVCSWVNKTQLSAQVQRQTQSLATDLNWWTALQSSSLLILIITDYIRESDGLGSNC